MESDGLAGIRDLIQRSSLGGGIEGYSPAESIDAVIARADEVDESRLMDMADNWADDERTSGKRTHLVEVDFDPRDIDRDTTSQTHLTKLSPSQPLPRITSGENRLVSESRTPPSGDASVTPAQRQGPMTNDSVAQDMFAVLHGQAAPVVMRWTYLVDDPFAVTFSIRTRSDRWVTWVMARDLLLAGLAGDVGVGDVRLCPRRMYGHEVLVVEISSPDGHAALEVDRELLGRFVHATTEVVPLGSESSAIDMDAEIETFTRSCAE